MKRYWERAAEYVGLDVDAGQSVLLERYGSWLASEGLRAGGIGPGERDRVDRRHLADSLLFAAGLSDKTEQVCDLGSGVGLPGIPLAIAMPRTSFTLVDRSGRRVDLMRRAIRILQLRNCHVTQADIQRLEGPVGSIVSRAGLPPKELTPIVPELLGESGVAVVAGSWRKRPETDGWEIVEIPEYVLDQTVWLLIMRRE